LEKGEVVIGRICDWNTFGGEKGGRRTGNDIIYYEFEYKDRLYKGKVWKFNYMPCYLQDEVVVLVNPQNTNQHIPFDDQNFFWELI
jgi:hypothetical protein